MFCISKTRISKPFAYHTRKFGTMRNYSFEFTCSYGNSYSQPRAQISFGLNAQNKIS